MVPGGHSWLYGLLWWSLWLAHFFPQIVHKTPCTTWWLVVGLSICHCQLMDEASWETVLLGSCLQVYQRINIIIGCLSHMGWVSNWSSPWMGVPSVSAPSLSLPIYLDRFWVDGFMSVLMSLCHSTVLWNACLTTGNGHFSFYNPLIGISLGITAIYAHILCCPRLPAGHQRCPNPIFAVSFPGLSQHPLPTPDCQPHNLHSP